MSGEIKEFKKKKKIECVLSLVEVVHIYSLVVTKGHIDFVYR